MLTYVRFLQHEFLAVRAPNMGIRSWSVGIPLLRTDSCIDEMRRNGEEEKHSPKENCDEVKKQKHQMAHHTLPFRC